MDIVTLKSFFNNSLFPFLLFWYNLKPKGYTRFLGEFLRGDVYFLLHLGLCIYALYICDGQRQTGVGSLDSGESNSSCQTCTARSFTGWSILLAQTFLFLNAQFALNSTIGNPFYMVLMSWLSLSLKACVLSGTVTQLSVVKLYCVVSAHIWSQVFLQG